MKLFYLLLLILGVNLPAAAQGIPGYVLTLPGDTLRGIIRENGDGRIAFYPSAGAAPQLYRAAQLRGYGIGRNPAVRSLPVRLARGTDSTRFAVAKLQGAASLYSYANGEGFLLQTAARDTLFELTPYNWHLLLNRHLRTCSSFRPTEQRILDLPFAEDNLIQVLSRYNKCVEPSWRPRRPSGLTTWQQGLAGYVGVLGLRASGAQAGAAWTFLKASGLQTSVQLGYTLLRFQDTYRNTADPQIEVREQAQHHLLTLGLAVGKRFGPPQRPNWYVGGGANLDFEALYRWQEQQRPVTGGSFRTTATRHVYAEDPIMMHAEISTGLIFPVAARRELRASVVYSLYSIRDVGYLGAQVTYCGFW